MYIYMYIYILFYICFVIYFSDFKVCLKRWGSSSKQILQKHIFVLKALVTRYGHFPISHFLSKFGRENQVYMTL